MPLQPQWYRQYKVPRCKLKLQRYIRCKSLAEASRKQVEDGSIQIHPDHHVQDWYRWLGLSCLDPLSTDDASKKKIISRIGAYHDNYGGVYTIPAYQVQIKGQHAADHGENFGRHDVAH